jgi:tRNA (cytidine/uridine-2'-O-)-methyltransferase
MLHVVLYEPEIPANTGNIGRLCVATGATLHLVGRIGFRLSDRELKRAGLDYWPLVRLQRHATLADFEASHPVDRLFCCENDPAGQLYTQIAYRPGDALLFGSESRGLPAEVLARHADRIVRIPMPTGAVRSLNLAGTVSILVYEALRQIYNW